MSPPAFAEARDRRSMVAAAAQQRRFHTLDAARGVAALAVLTVHWQPLMGPLVFAGAQRAVDLFFMMSGFVIALNYDARLQADLSASRFIVQRLVRLWPLSVLGTSLSIIGIVTALLVHTPTMWTWKAIVLFALCNAAFLPGPPSVRVQYQLFPLNVPSWSLFWEIAVNLMYAVARPLLTSKAINSLILVSGIALVGSLIYYGNLGGGFDWPSAPQAVPRVTFGFFVGVALYRSYSSGSLRAPAVPSFVAMMAVGIILWVPTLSGSRAWADGIFVLLVLPMLTAVLVVSQPRFGKRLCAFLGLVSYPLYALHFSVGKLAERLAQVVLHIRLADCAPFSGLALTAILIAACFFVEQWFDKPVRTRIGRALRRAS